ncbi:hypothetical protein PUNSTDRAFT_129095 [Punctularia strigosozonata HHB-11173 SS5]|uniref:uncharacterized protein n=1 Tax=Punctularia strigosozonata (strain HHB-11173) TaxID=741275 RepID=UPI0004417AD5|nr:uncharacterized protein PUNSTDRAFT_129095 [Punctularia strigosozonata HHB-11173 SS5]EIN13410.1 hypothetical protein PUNSTDRAFT_129095 [Punctularia strigosozonata HHB-11173 SS5]
MSIMTLFDALRLLLGQIRKLFGRFTLRHILQAQDALRKLSSMLFGRYKNGDERDRRAVVDKKESPPRSMAYHPQDMILASRMPPSPSPLSRRSISNEADHTAVNMMALPASADRHAVAMSRVSNGLLAIPKFANNDYVSRSSIDLPSTNTPYQRSQYDGRHQSTPNLHSPHVPLEGVVVPTTTSMGMPSSPGSSCHDIAGASVLDPVTVTIQPPEEPDAVNHDTSPPDVSPLDEPSGDETTLAGYDMSLPGTSQSRTRGVGSAPRTPSRAVRAVPAREVPTTPGQLGQLKDEHPDDYLRSWGIFPVDTDYVGRYDRHRILPSHESKLEISPMTLDVGYQSPPDPWRSYIHPEGCVYFWDPIRRLVTDVDLYDPELHRRIEDSATHLMYAKKTFSDPQFPEEAEIMLELAPLDGDNHLCYYYCINPKGRTLFWLNKMDFDWSIKEVKGITKLSQASTGTIVGTEWTIDVDDIVRDPTGISILACRSDTPKHWELFPLKRTVTESLLQELIGMMMQGGVDLKTSRSSTFSYSIEDVMHLMELLKNVNYVKEVNGYSAHVVGRVMSLLLHTQFLNLHGQQEARLSRWECLHEEEKKPPTLLIKILSPLLFFAPDIHMRSLRHVWVDKIVAEVAWKRFIEKIQSEWDKYLLPATVLLSVNVAFLAIPSVDQTNQAPNFLNFGNTTSYENSQTSSTFDFNAATPNRSAAQLASYVSTAASTGTIIIGLMLDRHHRLAHRMTAGEAALTLAAKEHPKYGIEALAILYSLPYALMMWGMISFALACCLLFFLGTNIPTWITLGLFCFISFLLIAWCMLTVWDTTQPWLLDHFLEALGEFRPAGLLTKMFRVLSTTPNEPELGEV